MFDLVWLSCLRKRRLPLRNLWGGRKESMKLNDYNVLNVLSNDAQISESRSFSKRHLLSSPNASTRRRLK